MQAPSNQKKTSAPATPTSGSASTNAKVDINQIRLGLAQVMDGLRTLAKAGALVSRPFSLTGGRILLPALDVHDHVISVMEVMDGRHVFTIDGISVMDGEKWQE